MKFRKSLVILPLLAICLAGCDLTSEDTTKDEGSEDEPETSETTPEGGEDTSSSDTTESGEGGEDTSSSDSTESGEGGETSSSDTTGGEEIEGYKVVFTFYDTTSAAQECPDYGSLYLQGNFADPNYTNWGSFFPLTETTDQSDNKAYYYIFDDLVVGATYTFNVVFTYGDEEPSWNPVRSSNFSMVIFSASNETDTEYVSLTGCYTFSVQFGLKTNSCTIAVNDTATASTQKALQISGTMQNPSWNAAAMTYDASGASYQYSYTFECSPNQEFTFGIFCNTGWNDALQIGAGTDTTGNCTSSGNNITINGNAIGEYTYTLIIFTVDGTNFGTSSHVTTTAVSITH